MTGRWDNLQPRVGTQQGMGVMVKKQECELDELGTGTVGQVVSSGVQHWQVLEADPWKA